MYGQSRHTQRPARAWIEVGCEATAQEAERHVVACAKASAGAMHGGLPADGGTSRSSCIPLWSAGKSYPRGSESRHNAVQGVYGQRVVRPALSGFVRAEARSCPLRRLGARGLAGACFVFFRAQRVSFGSLSNAPSKDSRVRSPIYKGAPKRYEKATGVVKMCRYLSGPDRPVHIWTGFRSVR